MHKLDKIPNLLKDKKDKSLFIVGGGPSLTDFDWGLLKDRNVLVINRGMQKVPNALALVWNDMIVHELYEKEINDFKGIKITTTRYSNTNICLCDIIWVKGKGSLSIRSPKIQESPYVIQQGGNTGFSALNVAYHLGAETIYLLGYDMKFGKDKETNWHDGYPPQGLMKLSEEEWPYPPPMNKDAYIDLHLMSFEGVNKVYQEKGIKIYNVNDDSRLTEFETKTMQEVFI